MDGKKGVKEVCQADTVRFGHKPKELTIAVEAPRTPLLDEIKARLPGASSGPGPVTWAAVRVTVEREEGRAGDDRNVTAWEVMVPPTQWAP